MAGGGGDESSQPLLGRCILCEPNFRTSGDIVMYDDKNSNMK